MRLWILLVLGLLVSCNQPSTGPANARIESVSWGQTVIGASLRLVQNKPAEILVYASGDRPGLTISLEARIHQGTALLGTLTLTGPASLPLQSQPLTPELAYRAELPLNWVVPGLKVEVLLDPNNTLVESDETDNNLISTPQVGTATKLYLTVVPVTYQGQSPVIPEFEPYVYQRWPLHDLEYQLRAPYTYTGTLTSDSLRGWSALLSQLSALRALDQSQGQPGASRYYYGFVRANYESGFAGIGYIGLPVAVGWDKANSANELMSHELGHNFGLLHAPCGGAANPDSNYPYPGASIGSWGIGLAQRQLKNPAQFRDLMSYCANTWVSDYNYALAQAFLESRPPNPFSPQMALDQLLFSGWISQGRVYLNPPLAYKGLTLPPQPGPYRLRLEGKTDLEVNFGVDTALVETHGTDAQAQPVKLFTFSLPRIESLEAVEVWRGTARLFGRTTQIRPTDRHLGLTTSRMDNRLKLDWNARLSPYLSLFYRLDSEMVPLALWMQGGMARVDISGLPPGAQLEVWASDGLDQWRLPGQP